MRSILPKSGYGHKLRVRLHIPRRLAAQRGESRALKASDAYLICSADMRATATFGTIGEKRNEEPLKKIASPCHVKDQPNSFRRRRVGRAFTDPLPSNLVRFILTLPTTIN